MQLTNRIIKTNLFTGALVLMLSVVLLSFSSPYHGSYVNKYKPLADSLSAIYGIPSAVMLGIAIVESGGGSSRNSKLLNNHFGIVGKNNLLKSKGIRSRYKQFGSVSGSYVGFCQMVSRKKYYGSLKGTADYNLWLTAMAKAGYSEKPEIWKKRVRGVIRQHKL